MAGNDGDDVIGIDTGGEGGSSQNEFEPDNNNEGDNTSPQETGNDGTGETGSGGENSSGTGETGSGGENSSGTGENNEGGGNNSSTPSLNVESKNKTFKARIFQEQNNQVYGAEIVLLDDTEVIDTILITDNLKLDSFNTLVENMEKAYLPYSEQDLSNLDILKRVASGDLTVDDEEYKLMKWSPLHDKGNLKTILENNIQLSNEEENSYEVADKTIINATHLDGKNSGVFSEKTHVHTDYLNISHINNIATTSSVGHAQIVDNLEESSLSDGKVLSARQGKVLNDTLKNLQNKVDNSWTTERKLNSYLSYKVNSLLGLIVCTYTRTGYTGFNSEYGTKLLHGKNTLPKEYCPKGNVSTPVLRGDVVLYYSPNGEVYIHSLVRQSSMDINVQVMWSY